MKAFISLLITLILIPVMLVAAVFGFVYFTFFNPQPADYPYLHSQAEIVSIEFASVSFEEGTLKAEGFGFVSDVEQAMTDLEVLECKDGLTLDGVSTLVNEKSVDGLIINYSDGSFEIITPYASINSSLKIETIEDVMSLKIYTFDPADFAQLIETHKADMLDSLPTLPDIIE